MMNYKLFKKIKNRKGFSLAEMLIAVLILLMVSSVVAAGMPVAVRAYTNVVDAANAQILLSTTITALRDELGEASIGNDAINGKKISYTSTTGGNSLIEFTDNGVTVTTENIYRVETTGGTDTKIFTRKLVSDKAAANMVFKINSIVFENNIIKISGIKVCRNGKTETLAELSELDIKVIGD